MRLRPVKEPEQSTERDEGRVLEERSINLPDRSLKALCYGGSHHRLSRYSTARAGLCDEAHQAIYEGSPYVKPVAVIPVGPIVRAAVNMDVRYGEAQLN